MINLKYYTYAHRKYSDKQVAEMKEFFRVTFEEQQKKFTGKTPFFNAREKVMEKFHISKEDASSVIATRPKKRQVETEKQLTFAF